MLVLLIYEIEPKISPQVSLQLHLLYRSNDWPVLLIDRFSKVQPLAASRVQVDNWLRMNEGSTPLMTIANVGTRAQKTRTPQKITTECASLFRTVVEKLNIGVNIILPATRIGKIACKSMSPSSSGGIWIQSRLLHVGVRYLYRRSRAKACTEAVAAYVIAAPSAAVDSQRCCLNIKENISRR